jgi:putative hydrolase of the HAD superfamily
MTKRVWVFDLDNTLHDANPHIFPHINKSMTEYVQRFVGLDEAEANALRQYYWRRYGATLKGLMQHHDTQPAHFLWHTHQFPRLPEMVLRERILRHMLKRLPGRKLVFTNAPRHYAHAVLALLKVEDVFDDVFAIEDTAYRPKPEPQGYYALLRKHRLHPAQCTMVEDSLENLHAAKRLGMRTVWVDASNRLPAYVDVKIRTVMDLPRAIARL